MKRRVRGTWVFSGLGGLLAAVICLAADREPAVPPIRIMPLGDSITQGAAGHDSYRRDLWQMLAKAGYRVDFVGSQQANHRGPSAHQDYDPDHEGHWGWTVEEVVARLDAWAASARPDVVLLHLGTNDAGSGEAPERILDELRQVLDILRRHNPCVRILVAQLIPIGDSWSERQVRVLNARLPAWAQSLSTSSSPVVVVDQHTGFDVETDTYDGVHPGDSGNRKMAQRWFEALQGVLAAGPGAGGVPESTTGTGCTRRPGGRTGAIAVMGEPQRERAQRNPISPPAPSGVVPALQEQRTLYASAP